MKLRNKKTGEIIVCDGITESLDYPNHYVLKNGWEDYEEPKTVYIVDTHGIIEDWTDFGECNWEDEKEIGNYFETKEEAEQALEKLKAWKRLRDAGFKFEGVTETWFGGGRVGPMSIQFNKHDDDVWVRKHHNDLELLFGGEE